LSPRTDAAADVLDAAGYDWVFIESVGVGQVELDIRNLVDTTLVALVPESGDQVQAIKAGLMEIADLYVVNKCDRPGAGAMVAAVQSSVALQHHPDPAWMPRVMGAAVINNEGIAEILTELERHRQHLSRDGRLLQGRRLGLMARLRKRMEQQLAARLLDGGAGPALEQAVERILSGEESLEQVSERCLSEWMEKLGGGMPRGSGT
jgi:LAO/AO transport system kinase